MKSDPPPMAHLRVFAAVLVVLALSLVVAAEPKFGLDGENLVPWANGLFNLTPVDLGSIPSPSEAKFPLVLAAKQTRRPDMLRHFKLYRGGWNVTNGHYWVSVGFTGASGFILAFLWFVFFGLLLGIRYCYKWGIHINSKGSEQSRRICLALLLIFTCAASIGCILLSVGQTKFHGEVLDTLHFVVNQSDFTVQILKNVTGFLSLAKTINVDQVILPVNIQSEIDKLNIDLNDAADTLVDKTTVNSQKIELVFYKVQCLLIVIATVMVVLAIFGLLLSIYGHQNAIFIFIFSGWILVTVTFSLCGLFVVLNNSVSDTCTAMGQWVENPHAETALSSLLPCVDEKTTNLTLHRSKEVTRELVNVVNTVIGTIANSNNVSQGETSYYYNLSGPIMPYLCSPYDSELMDRPCDPQEVSLTNASLVWVNYTCSVSSSGVCVSRGRLTPDMYTQLSGAVNASFALDHYTPLLLSLQDCNFVRDTFTTVTSHYCPRIEHELDMVNAGLAMLSSGVMPCLILWILYANRPRREEVFAELSEVKVAKDSKMSAAGEKVAVECN